MPPTCANIRHWLMLLICFSIQRSLARNPNAYTYDDGKRPAAKIELINRIQLMSCIPLPSVCTASVEAARTLAEHANFERHEQHLLHERNRMDHTSAARDEHAAPPPLSDESSTSGAADGSRTLATATAADTATATDASSTATAGIGNGCTSGSGSEVSAQLPSEPATVAMTAIHAATTVASASAVSALDQAGAETLSTSTLYAPQFTSFTMFVSYCIR